MQRLYVYKFVHAKVRKSSKKIESLVVNMLNSLSNLKSKAEAKYLHIE